MDDKISFPLDSVVLGALRQDAFLWSKTELFSRGLLLCACKKPVIAHQGKPLECPDDTEIFENDVKFQRNFFANLHVLQSEPLQFGHIGLKTKITIAEYNPTERKISQPGSISPGLFPSVLNSLTVGCRTTSDRNVASSSFCSKSIWTREADLCVCYNFSSFQKACLRDGLKDCDIFNTICITKQFACSTGLLDKCYIEVHLKTENRTNEKQPNVFIVKVLDNFKCVHKHLPQKSCDSGMIALPTVLNTLQKFSHVQSAPTTVCFKLLQHQTTYGCSSLYCDAPLQASEVRIKCVRSPMYSCTADFSELLMDYFSIPRIVRKNKVLILPTQAGAATELWHDLYDPSEGQASAVYFKIVHIQQNKKSINTAVACRSFTKLLQETACESFAPTYMQHILSFHSCPVPPGMSKHHTEVCKILQTYLSSRKTCENSRSGEAVCPHILLSGSSGCGLTSLVKTVAMALNLHCIKVLCELLVADSAGATEAKLQQAVQVAKSHAPCILLLEHIHLLGWDRDGTTEDPRVGTAFQNILQSLSKSTSEFPVFVIATSSKPKHVHPGIVEAFLYHHKVQALDEHHRAITIQELCNNQSLNIAKNVDFQNLAQKTAGMMLADLSALISYTQKVAYRRVLDWCQAQLGFQCLSWLDECYLASAGYSLHMDDFQEALNKLQSSQVDRISTAKIPEVRWDDIGGLEDAKTAILETIQLPLQQPELFSAGMRRSGVLLYGPPGTGKTLCAKAVATECSLNFLSVKGPELINMYVGQSEENIREVFQRARDASPCVIFFDELDSLAPNRGRSGDSGGVMDRVVSQLLAELDGVTKSSDVFVIGATNRPDLLDSALLRPGRFDKLIYIGVSENKEQQLQILNALTKKFDFDPDVRLEDVVAECPLNMTGADFYALCSSAMLSAITNKIHLLDKGENVDQSVVEVKQEDFLKAIRNLTPSVSDMEMQRYKFIQEKFV